MNLTSDPAVLVPLFASLGWPPRLRLVSQDWRYVFDKWCPRASKESKKVYRSIEEVNAASKDASIPRWIGCYVSIVHRLSVTSAELREFTQYGNVHTFSCCTNVVDVSALGDVHTLYLCNCTGVRDVSALRGVHTLNLSHCTGVVDVSALGGVHTLDLYGCTGMVDVSALGSVHTLSLRYCTGVVDVSALGGVHTLDLYGCTGVRDVSALVGKVVNLIRP